MNKPLCGGGLDAQQVVREHACPDDEARAAVRLELAPAVRGDLDLPCRELPHEVRRGAAAREGVEADGLRVGRAGEEHEREEGEREADEDGPDVVSEEHGGGFYARGDVVGAVLARVDGVVDDCPAVGMI